MSGTAALAAAKRRRNPIELQQASQPQLNRQTNSYDNGLKKNPNSGTIHPFKLALEHDKQIFILERKLELLEQNGLSSESGGVSEELENMVRNNSSEVKLLKASLQKQQKSIQELNTLVTSLRGKLANQDSLIDKLTEELANMSTTPVTVGTSDTESVSASASSSTVTFTVKESAEESEEQ